MVEKIDIVERLRACENDPMWADHAEIPKIWCKQAADQIEKLRAEIKTLNHELDLLEEKSRHD